MKNLWLILFVAIPTLSFALPEFARYGYFSCTSCHVSPGGGGMLTSSDRGCAGEILTTWSKENAGNLLHGLIKEQSEKFLFEGHWGQVQFQENNYEIRKILCGFL